MKDVFPPIEISWEKKHKKRHEKIHPPLLDVYRLHTDTLILPFKKRKKKEKKKQQRCSLRCHGIQRNTNY